MNSLVVQCRWGKITGYLKEKSNSEFWSLPPFLRMLLSSLEGIYFIICINSRGHSLGEPFETVCLNVALLFRISFITFPRHSACVVLICVIRVCSPILAWFLQEAISDGFLRNAAKHLCSLISLFSAAVLCLIQIDFSVCDISPLLACD